MSYPMDLDDYREADLLKELARRKEFRAQGLCDYCGRRPIAPSCKFPDRHRMAAGRDEHDGHMSEAV